MGILDWFINRPSQFDPDHLSDELTLRAIDKAVSLTNPRLKFVDAYRERLTPAVETSIHYLRSIIRSLPPPIPVSSSRWSSVSELRAFFASASDIPLALGRSSNLRTLLEKFPELEEAHLILGMSYSEQRVLGMSLQGDVVQREVVQRVVSFSNHQARICGHSDAEVRRLLGTQAFEYLVAQALSEIGAERSERKDLETKRALIRSRLRLFQQHGPGLGTVFGSAPAEPAEQIALEAQLMENERQLEALGSPQSSLEKELECLCEVLLHPENYVCIEPKMLRLSTMNVVMDAEEIGSAAKVSFSLANLKGVPQVQQAFVIARFPRDQLPSPKSGLEAAERYL
ncbi:MAG: hypothetical protein WCK63_11210 [Betaproteobacteria bacterium]